jgi:predicted XRE-type DNA-binding protein
MSIPAKTKIHIARTPDELGKHLRLTKADVALMKHKALLSSLAVKAIEDSGLTVNEIVKRSGVARSKVSAVKNGAVVSISCDLLIKILTAAGKRLEFRAA